MPVEDSVFLVPRKKKKKENEAKTWAKFEPRPVQSLFMRCMYTRLQMFFGVLTFPLLLFLLFCNFPVGKQLRTDTTLTLRKREANESNPRNLSPLPHTRTRPVRQIFRYTTRRHVGSRARPTPVQVHASGRAERCRQGEEGEKHADFSGSHKGNIHRHTDSHT